MRKHKVPCLVPLRPDFVGIAHDFGHTFSDRINIFVMVSFNSGEKSEVLGVTVLAVIGGCDGKAYERILDFELVLYPAYLCTLVV